VHMAQPWAMREPLIDGQGNFGSVEGDPPAAMRYTEARMTAAAMGLLDDLELGTVDFQPNYDETRQEPSILPGKARVLGVSTWTVEQDWRMARAWLSAQLAAAEA